MDDQKITCRVCDWFCPPPINDLLGAGSPDVILIADCVWISSLIAPLLQTLSMYSDSFTKVIITYQQRGRHVHDEFWKGIHDLFDVNVVDTEKAVWLAKPDAFFVLECTKKV